MNEVLQQFLMQLALNAIPVVIPLVVALIVKLITEAWTAVKQQQPDLAWELERGATFAVHAAEQVGLTDALKDLADSKLTYAIGICEAYLAEKGIKNIDIDLIRAAIEAEVIRAFPHYGSKANG